MCIAVRYIVELMQIEILLRYLKGEIDKWVFALKKSTGSKKESDIKSSQTLNTENWKRESSKYKKERTWHNPLNFSPSHAALWISPQPHVF